MSLNRRRLKARRGFGPYAIAGSRTDNDKPRGDLPIETLTKLGGLAAVAAYAAGLVIVNAFLLQYGASEFSLFRGRFILTGVVFLSVVGLATMGPLLAFYFARDWYDGWFRDRPADATGRFLVWDALFVAFMFIAAPAGVYRFALGQSWWQSTVLYFLAGVLGGCVLLIAFFWRTPKNIHPRHQRPGQRTPPWTFYFLIAFFLLPYAGLTMTEFATEVLPAVPEQLGGASGRQEQFLLKADSTDGFLDLGIDMIRKGDTTVEVTTLFSGEDFYLVSYDRHVYVLDSSIVLARKPVE